MRELTLSLLWLSFCALLPAQRQAENWHFGNNINIAFVDGVPTLLTTSSMETFEGCVSYSDVEGQLLFYTNGGGRVPDVSLQDGGTIWNRNHDIMYEMNGAEGGGFSAIQSSIAFPVPGQDDQYYLFTMEENEFDIGGPIPGQPQGRGLSYFIIDMTLNGGLGGVALADQRVFIPSFESLSATPIAGGTGHWVVCSQGNNEGLVVVSVTESGVGTPSLQATDLPVAGQFKISPNGQYILADKSIYAFDNLSGTVSPTPVFSIENGSNLTASFTPDSRYIYAISFVNGQRLLIRFDLAATDIAASAATLANLGTGFAFQMQIGPNGSLYFLEEEGTTNNFGLSEITCPSTASPTLTRILIDLTGTSEALYSGLPNFVDAIFAVPPSINDTVFVNNTTRGRCPGGDLILSPNTVGESYSWSTGDTTRSITVLEDGTYSVTISGSCVPTVESFPVAEVPELMANVASLEGSDSCPGDIVTLSLQSSESLFTIEWPDGSDSLRFQTTVVPGDTVSVRIGTRCGRETINYIFPPAEGPLTGMAAANFSSPLCLGDPVEFVITGDFIEAIEWEDSSSDQVRTVMSYDTAVSYQATVFNRCGDDSLVLIPEIDLSPFTVDLMTDSPSPLCPGDEVTFTLTGDFIDFLVWEDFSGDLERNIMAIDSSVTYQATVFNRCGDSLVVTPDLDYSQCPIIEECDAAIPQLITPNGDGVNDGFRVFSSCTLEDYALRIFNRWGQVVFTSTNPAEAWDGKLNGVNQAMDTYLYKVRYRFPGEENSIETDGDLVLVR
ncbi:MAG: gliding motility-associated C-terminal domain-containing protein [Bacteroidota bacterium]